jgi:hypothetical protein
MLQPSANSNLTFKSFRLLHLFKHNQISFPINYHHQLQLPSVLPVKFQFYIFSFGKMSSIQRLIIFVIFAMGVCASQSERPTRLPNPSIDSIPADTDFLKSTTLPVLAFYVLVSDLKLKKCPYVTNSPHRIALHCVLHWKTSIPSLLHCKSPIGRLEST